MRMTISLLMVVLAMAISCNTGMPNKPLRSDGVFPIGEIRETYFSKGSKNNSVSFPICNTKNMSWKDETQYRYDDLNRLISVATVSSSGDVLSSTKYEYSNENSYRVVEKIILNQGHQGKTRLKEELDSSGQTIAVSSIDDNNRTLQLLAKSEVEYEGGNWVIKTEKKPKSDGEWKASSVTRRILGKDGRLEKIEQDTNADGHIDENVLFLYKKRKDEILVIQTSQDDNGKMMDITTEIYTSDGMLKAIEVRDHQGELSSISRIYRNKYGKRIKMEKDTNMDGTVDIISLFC